MTVTISKPAINIREQLTELKNTVTGGTGVTVSSGEVSIGQDVGTTDSVTFGGLTVDTDTLHVDATNDRVGIGTASPTGGKLQIETTAEPGLFVKDTGITAAPYVRVQGQRNDGNLLSSFSGGLALEAYRTGAKIPNGKHLGTIYFGGNHTNGTEANISYAASISGVSDGAFDGVADMPTAIAFHTGSSGTALGTPNTTFGTERMRIDSSGNVGIGTSSPGTTLDVDGEIRQKFTDSTNLWTHISSNATAPMGNELVIQNNATDPDQTDLDTPTMAGLFFRAGANSSSSAFNTARIAAVRENGFNTSLAFATRQSGAGGMAERMRIDSSGNVGIGTTTPTGLLELSAGTGDGTLNLVSTANASNAGNKIAFFAANRSTTDEEMAYIKPLLVSNSGGAGNVQTGDLTFGTSGTERMRITSDGKVGINKTPSALLDVNGDAIINSVTVGRGGGNLGTNTAAGFEALYSNTTGVNCVAVGSFALRANDTANNSTAVGRRAARSVTSGASNCAFGLDALRDATTGNNNAAIGTTALKLLTTGAFNTAAGVNAGNNITTGSRNIFVGRNAFASANNVNDEIVIGHAISGKGADTAFIGGTNGAYNEDNSSTWTTTSDERIKKNIVDNNSGLDLLAQVQVRNFEYRTPEEITELPASSAVNKTGVQLGVIAQELQTVLPECVKETSSGVLSVSTDNLLWYLINAVKELKAEIDTLKGN